MKKLFSLLVLTLSIGSLVGCSFVNPEDQNKISKIFFTGSMQKKEYLWDDEWDATGLTVKATTVGGETYALSNDKYTLNFSRKAPKNYLSSLQITAKLKEDLLKTASVTYRDIKVADEVYDNDSEVKKYYKHCNLESSSLLKELQKHSFSKHTYFVKYGETQNFLSKNSKTMDVDSPDIVPNAHKIEMFYTNNQTDFYIGTREHVWPCNDSNNLWAHGKVDESDYIGGGSDLYHIRPCDSLVNTARGDAPYVDFDDSEFSSKKSRTVEVGDDGPYKLKLYGATKVKEGIYEYADLVEPADEVKGDIARIVAYVYMHYNSNGGAPSKYASMTGSLSLTKVIGFSTLSRAKAVLKEWNKLDPVSPVETHRNHTVEQIQGNRNPFVDYPDLIDKVF